MCVLPYTNYILNQISTLVYSRAVSKKKKSLAYETVFLNIQNFSRITKFHIFN